MRRPLTTWERDVLTALVSVDGPAGGPDGAVLRESIPHLLVTGGCECGCPSFFVRDSRLAGTSEAGAFHYSNAATPDGRVGLFLLVKDGRPWSVDVLLPPDLDGSEPDARPDPGALVVTSPYEEQATRSGHRGRGRLDRVRDDEVFGGLDDDERDVLVALVSCGGHVAVESLRTAATAWAAAGGRVLEAAEFDTAVRALDGTFCDSVAVDQAVLLGPAGPVAVEQWLAERLPVLRALVESAVHFDQARWAARLLGGGGEELRPDVFAAARRTWDTRSVVWRPRPPNARRGAPPYFPPQRDPMARLGLVAALLDRDDAEAREWVTGLLPQTRQEWADHDRESVVAALPALAGLLPEGAAALVAQAVAGDERHGFGWADLARLRAEHPTVFPDDVWDDVRKRYARWAKRRLTYPMNDAARAEMADTSARLGVVLDTSA